MKFVRHLSFLLTLLLVKPIFAQDIQIVGQIQQPIHPTPHHRLQFGATKSITLLKMSLSESAQQTLKRRLQTLAHTQAADASSNTVSKVQLGMNGVPVLDQGAHGTCVTFSVTAAIDALLNRGDYISQICQLALGNHLENHGYMPSGWDGSWARTVLSQMELFGIINKTTQKSLGCAGFSEYPLTGQDPTTELPLPEFHQLSEKLPRHATHWVPLIEPYQFANENIDDDLILSDVKQALNAGDRVVFGVLLFDFTQGVVGAVGKHHAMYDTWTLTPELMADLHNQPEFGGHAMVITGYDDHAVATDTQGRTYHGLLTLRNSWGAGIGDEGNFYMTYDYFRLLVIEAQRLKK